MIATRILIPFLTATLLFSCGGSDKKSPAEEIKSERTTEKTFIGNWRVFNDEGIFFYISINPDGTASNTWEMGEQGNWEVLNGKILLKWSSGWKDIIFIEDGAFKKIAFEPGKSIEESPSSRAKAERVNKIPTN